MGIWDDLDKRKTPEWYENAKFGIFVHWGPYSVPAYRALNDEIFGSYAEWYYASVYGNYKNIEDKNFHKNVFGNIEYRDFAKQFKCELFNCKEFIKTIKSSGAKYIVVTAKHHDGYCMWKTDNKYKKNWNAFDNGPKLDLLEELKHECDYINLNFGLYYSIIDWESVPSSRCNGGYFIPLKDVLKYGLSKEVYLKEVLHKQLYELVEKFSPKILFADGGEWDLNEEESGVIQFLSWLYTRSNVKKDIVVNDRFCKNMQGKHGDFFSTEYNDKIIDNHLWEESRGIGKSYGYNRAQNLSDILSTQDIIGILVRTISKGGNFLLNIGPNSDGTIPIYEQERLKGIGEWLAENGEAVYGTRKNRDKLIKFGTLKDDKTYIFFKKDNIYENLLNITVRVQLSKKFYSKNKKVDILGVEEGCEYFFEDNYLIINVKKAGILFRKNEIYGINTIKIY